MNFCCYYQALVNRAECLFLSAVFRNESHVAFVRTLDKKKDILEFFVPQAMEQRFLHLMNYFQTRGIVFTFEKLPHRLENPDEQI